MTIKVKAVEKVIKEAALREEKQITKRKGKKYEGGNMENDYSGDCQYSDGSTDGTRNDVMYGQRPIL